MMPALSAVVPGAATAGATEEPPHNEYVFTRAEYDELVKKLGKEQVSKRSDYEEIELIEDCTLYDIYRQPRPPVTDESATKTLPVRVLNAELTCPICLGIIRETTVVMECLHRFCRECIQKSLRVTNKECPSCRIHIPSKRSLRDDLNFDALIAKIYPDVDEFEEKENHLIEEINRSRHFNNAFTESTKIGVRNQASIRRQVRSDVSSVIHLSRAAFSLSSSLSWDKQGGKKKQPPAQSTSATSAAPSRSTSPSPPPVAAAVSPPPAVGDKRSATEAAASPGTSNATDEEGDDNHKKPRTSPDSTASTNNSTDADAAARAAPKSPTAPAPPDRVNLRVVLHPEESTTTPKLERTLFTTSYRLKIRQLKKHLRNLLKLESSDNMRIVLPAENCALSGLSSAVSGESAGAVIRRDLLFDQELEDYMTIYDIYQQYGMGTKWELRLQYHFSDSIVNGVAQFLSSGAQG